MTRVAAPARALAQRFALLLLLIAAASLLVLGKTRQDAISHLRTLAIDTLAPVLDAASRPVDATRQGIAEVRHFLFTYQENRRLREDISRLAQWQQIARKLEQENDLLRAKLNVVPAPRLSYISARVIADSGGPFVKTLLVNAGRNDGVKRGQAVVTAAGLAGRVVEVGRSAARLLLLTDLNSRVPVVVESSRYRGILAGDNSGRPRLIFLPASAKVGAGDRIVTSGHGGVFPPGLPVGTVSSVIDGKIRVEPFVDWDRIEYVSILRYDLPGLDALGATEAKRGVEGG
ncbi:MAG TPA: rod shape-determining protein MreC [Alphaproteobacteria bacterium]|nr:rod shape-determining protein MreC [Alphaproteobacteria bacterium]